MNAAQEAERIREEQLANRRAQKRLAAQRRRAAAKEAKGQPNAMDIVKGDNNNDDDEEEEMDVQIAEEKEQPRNNNEEMDQDNDNKEEENEMDIHQDEQTGQKILKKLKPPIFMPKILQKCPPQEKQPDPAQDQGTMTE